MKIKQIGKRVLATALCFLLMIGGMSLPINAADDYYSVSFEEVVGKFETDYGTTQHDTRIGYFEDFIGSEVLAEFFFDYATGFEYFTILFPQSNNSSGGYCIVYLTDAPFVFYADENGNAVLDTTSRPFSVVRRTQFNYSGYYQKIQYSTPATYSGTSLNNAYIPECVTTDFSIVTTRNANYLWATNYPLCDSSGALVLGGIGDTEISFPEFPEMQEFKDISEFLGSITENAPSMENYNIFIPDDEFNTNDIVAAALRIILLIQQLPKLISFFIDTVAYYLSHITDILVALFDFMSTNVIIAVTNINLILKYIGDLISTGIEYIKQLLAKEFDFNFDSSPITSAIEIVKNILENSFNTTLENIKGIKDFFETNFTIVKNILETTFTQNLTDIVEKMKNLPSNISAAIRLEIIALFIPADDYLENAIDTFAASFERAYPIVKTVEDITTAIESAQLSGNSLVIKMGGQQIISSEHGVNIALPEIEFTADIIQEIRRYTDPIIVAISYFSAILFFKNQLPILFGGVGGGTAAVGDQINLAMYEKRNKD